MFECPTCYINKSCSLFVPIKLFFYNRKYHSEIFVSINILLVIPISFQHRDNIFSKIEILFLYNKKFSIFSPFNYTLELYKNFFASVIPRIQLFLLKAISVFVLTHCCTVIGLLLSTSFTNRHNQSNETQAIII